jgi:hypothetical protein
MNDEIGEKNNHANRIQNKSSNLKNKDKNQNKK